MLDKIKRKPKVSMQDRTTPKTIEDLRQRYDLENTDINDFLDTTVDKINKTMDIKDNGDLDLKGSLLKNGVPFTVVDNLTSTSTTDALSANQGNVLAGGTLKSKIITATRDAGATSGDISYTGVGFKPSSIHCLMVVNGTTYRSDGVSDSNKDVRCTYQSAANTLYIGSMLASYTNYTSWAQNAVVKSYDSDGFTLTWTKIGTPTAETMQLVFICYR